MRKYAIILCVITALSGISAVHAELLNPNQENHLRFRFQNIFNELDLLIRNHQVDHADVQKQERDFQRYRAFERIPFAENLGELQAELKASARGTGLEWKSFRLIRRSKARKIPSQLYTDEPPFHPSQDQIVKTLYFESEVSGNPLAVQAWMNSWPSELTRMVEVDESEIEKKENHPTLPQQRQVFRVRGHAYQFLDAKFPSLDARNPLELLPRTLRSKPETFARAEPELWRLVNDIQRIYPKAKPYYRNREEFLLNDARLSFFLSKTRAQASAQH